MSWENNQTIRFRLGSVALWNFLSRATIQANDPTLQLMKTSFERMQGVHAGITNEFADMTARELPASEEARRARMEKYL